MSSKRLHPSLRLAATALAAVLAGCIVSPTHDAPIVDRSQGVANAPMAVPKPAPAERPAAVSAREAHDGMYVVQAGDTLYSVALAFGQDFRDIARWNTLDDPAHLQVGQSLRVVQGEGADAGGGAAEAVPVPISPSGQVQTRPLDSTAAAAAPGPDNAAPAARAPGADRPGADKAGAIEPESTWAWPAAGKLLDRFDEARNKGIEIAGSIGDAVVAANDGQVVYSGNGLRGYGNLVIIKHTDDYVSAYAHNNEILVTQGQAVKRGQRIATLGTTDAPNPRLHFEIRRRGKPVDPLAYLPSR
jgi:lipoprotein NlpD